MHEMAAMWADPATQDALAWLGVFPPGVDPSRVRPWWATVAQLKACRFSGGVATDERLHCRHSVQKLMVAGAQVEWR
jgi:hypothetical protein